MFELKFRIENEYARLRSMTLEEFNEDNVIDALFRFKVNEHQVGYYHDDELDSEEIGAEYVTDWFILLLEASIKLKNHNNVSIAITGWGAKWINFKKHDDKLLISDIEKESEPNKFIPCVNTEEFTDYKVLDFENEEITFEEFKTEVVKKSRMFVDKLIRVNSAFKDSTIVKELNGFIDEILKD